jgi:broad specificity phosphatase PhoE
VPTILLVRHGQASFGTADYDQLSPVGAEQAAVVAAELDSRHLNVQRIVSGSLRRQLDTAAPTAALFGVEVETDPRWNEYAMDEILIAHSRSSARVSTPEGERPPSQEEFQDAIDPALAAWIDAGADTTAAESWPAFSARTLAALRELADSLEPNTTGLAFTSGGVIALISAALLELPAIELLRLNRVSVNTSVTKIISGRRGLSLVSFNEHSHLERVGRRFITYR